MTTTQSTEAPTPGYSTRIMIWFATDKHGMRVAYRWCFLARRAIRISLADAEIMRASDTADVIPHHPMRAA